MLANPKKKGSDAERELLHRFWETGRWIALRAPSSGAIKYPCPDLLVGNAQRKLAIECKTTSAEKQYLSDEQMEGLKRFSGIFAAEPWVAVRFQKQRKDSRDWFFLSIEDLQHTGGGNYCISRENAEFKGLSFEEISGC